MGIKGLSKFVRKYAVPRDIEYYKDQTFVIDAFIYLYKFKFGGNVLKGIENQVAYFKRNGITPIYVFDGKKPEEKKETMQKRKIKNATFVTKEEIQQVKDFLDVSGVKWTVAPSEGEKFCAYINKIGDADVVLSNDYDTLLFGCKKLLTCDNNKEYFEYDTEEILGKIKLTLEQLVEICIASGSDYYASGIKGIGVIKALKLLKINKFKKIEEWDVELDEEFRTRLEVIRNIFVDFEKEKMNNYVDCKIFE